MVHRSLFIKVRDNFNSISYGKCGRGQLKCDSTRAESIFRVSAKRTGPFKSAGASVQSTTGSRGVRISGNNAGYTMFRGSVKGTGNPLHSPVSPSLHLPASPCAITFQLESTYCQTYTSAECQLATGAAVRQLQIHP